MPSVPQGLTSQQQVRVPPGWLPHPYEPRRYVPAHVARAVRRHLHVVVIPPPPPRLPPRRAYLTCRCEDVGTCHYCRRALQLQVASRAVQRAREDLADVLLARDALVVLAVDGGMSQKQVAQLLHVSQPHVNRILTRSQPGAAAATAG